MPPGKEPHVPSGPWGSFLSIGTFPAISRFSISPVGGNAGFFMEGTEDNGNQIGTLGRR